MQPLNTSMVPSVKLVPNQREPYSNPRIYIRLVGKLNYLTVTYLDITFVVNVVNQSSNTSRQDYRDAITWILKYIKKAFEKGPIYEDKKNT